MSEVDWNEAPSDTAVFVEDLEDCFDMWCEIEDDKLVRCSNGNCWEDVGDIGIKIHYRPDNWKEGEKRMDPIGQNGNDGHYDELENNKSKYHREIKKGVMVDVYDVLNAFEVVNPAMQHALKKMLAPGKRGAKDTIQDMKEAIQSIERAIELEDDK